MESYIEQILNSIRSKDVSSIKDVFLIYHPFDLSEAIRELSNEDVSFLFSNMEAKTMGPIIAYLDHEHIVSFFETLKPKYIVQLIQEFALDDAVDLIQAMPRHDRAAYLKLMDESHREKIQSLIHYEHDTAGAMMTPEYIEINVNDSVEIAMKKLIHHAVDAETINVLYVTDEYNVLVGTINLRQLIVARKGQQISMLMNTRVISCTTSMDQEDVANIFKNYDLTTLPVVDQKKRMLGIITIDDIVDVIEEEANEDYGLLAGVKDIDIDHTSETVWKSAKKRLPWLLILSFLGFLTSTIIAQFQDTISIVPSIALFLPMILGMAGNTGTQSLAVTIRGIVNDEFSTRFERYKHLLREVGTGFLNGLILGILLFTFTWLFLMMTQTEHALMIAQSVSVAVVLSLTIATFAGALIPMVIHALGIDPAIASGPFVTMIVDLLGITIYFSLATFFMVSLF